MTSSSNNDPARGASNGPPPALAPNTQRRTPRRRRLSADALVEGILNRNTALLARAITLIESTLPRHQALAGRILDALAPHTGRAHRIGITGVPGVGKSTFIDAFGTFLTQRGHRVAVLTIDPSSTRSGGSILGDKTRMERLSHNPDAFIRPSPSSGTLGGVARTTREVMLACEAAGFDVVIVETVGVGQSETVVADMTDVFLVLMIAGAGDELQGIKRGLMEVADVLAVNKADGDNLRRAQRAARMYHSALRTLHASTPDRWIPPVLTCSALHDTGLDAVWDTLSEHRQRAQDSGAWDDRRRRQRLIWLWDLVDARLRAALTQHPDVASLLPELKTAVLSGDLPPRSAADRIMATFLPS